MVQGAVYEGEGDMVMTREEAERLVVEGAGRWNGSVLVLNQRGPALVHSGVPVSGRDCLLARFSWPGWVRATDGSWSFDSASLVARAGNATARLSVQPSLGSGLGFGTA